MREGVRETLGEPDEIQTGGTGAYKYELWFYLNKDLNRVYEFRKSASGCGGSGQWYVEYLYYADYHFGMELYVAPTIIHEPVKAAPIGQDISITAEITDDVQVVSADLMYRAIDAPEYTPVSMSVSDTLYTAVIPASVVTTAGVEYYIQASDGQHSSRLPLNYNDTYRITVKAATTKKTLGPVESTRLKGTPAVSIPDGAGVGSSPLKP
ncbi:hypothetical protein LLG96_15885 [bacterium]|nr:hypothetical protein [bacterium]